jgi:glycine cleavage system H protein
VHRTKSKSSSNVKETDAGRSGRLLGTVPADADECVWMRAQVVSYKLCDRALDCESCPLDMALRGDTAGWQGSAQPGATAAGTRLYPRDRRFSASHTWVHAPVDHPARVGIDAMLAWLVGEVGAVQLAPIDAWLDRGDTVATLVTDEVMIKIRTPISGRVLSRNDLLASCPDLVVAAPYGAGWLADLAAAPERQGRQQDDLMSGSQMEKLAQTDLHRFHRRVDSMLTVGRAEVGSTMADGGEPVGDARAMLGNAHYLQLVQEIFT